MATQPLPTDFKDDILASSMDGKRRYHIIDNGDGTVSFEDVTEYTQTGSDFGAKEVNEERGAINELDSKKFDKSNVSNSLLVTEEGFSLDARQGNVLSDRMGALGSLTTGVKTSIVNAINWLKSQLDTTNSNVANLNNKLTPNIHNRISGVAQTGTAGRIYAQKNGKYIDIDIVLSGCSVGTVYAWYNIGYVDVSKLGVTSTEYAYGQAYYSGGGPAYGDEGGQTTIRCESQSSGRIQLLAQCSKMMSGGKYFIASIHVPIVS